ncbi:hypothetical protein ACK12G_09410 [Mycolicibacterium wolinskyi]|uniref:hypothetical protein n=1 Tax=Mycolicibacterium wolinskyi TaxID=59750 RepID=UPI0039177784
MTNPDGILDALAIIEAIARNDDDAQRAILAPYLDEGAGDLVIGLAVVAMSLANVGVAQGAWPDAQAALQLARLGVLDVTNNTTEENDEHE